MNRKKLVSDLAWSLVNLVLLIVVTCGSIVWAYERVDSNAATERDVAFGMSLATLLFWPLLAFLVFCIFGATASVRVAWNACRAYSRDGAR